MCFITRKSKFEDFKKQIKKKKKKKILFRLSLKKIMKNQEKRIKEYQNSNKNLKLKDIIFL